MTVLIRWKQFWKVLCHFVIGIFTLRTFDKDCQMCEEITFPSGTNSINKRHFCTCGYMNNDMVWDKYIEKVNELNKGHMSDDQKR